MCLQFINLCVEYKSLWFATFAYTLNMFDQLIHCPCSAAI